MSEAEAAAEVAEELEALDAIYGDDIIIKRHRSSDNPPRNNSEEHSLCCTSDDAPEKNYAYTVRVRCGPDKQCELEAWLPAGYPIAPPIVTVRVGNDRNTALNDTLHTFMTDSPHPEAPVLFELISWVDENAPAAVPAIQDDETNFATEVDVQACDNSCDHSLLMPEPPSVEDGAKKQQADTNGTKERIDRQWIWFIGFYTKSIIKAFCTTAGQLGCTGFLMPGKPAVAAVEGCEAAINDFLKITRTELFAKVPPASRKMKLCLLDRDIPHPIFNDFSEVTFKTTASAHKRKDMADLGGLEAYLSDLGLSHAFNEIFDSAVRS